MPNSPTNSGSSDSDRSHFRLRGVQRRFQDTAALSEVDLEIRKGEAVALVGPSGSGKTTLLRLLNGTIHPTSGAVSVYDQDLHSLPPKELRRVRSRIGFVHQDHCLIPNVRVSQNVIAGKFGSRSFFESARAWLFPSASDLERVHQILERVGIPEKMFQRTDTLSGGQQQRVAIARALFQEPEAILADEPVSAVDPARAKDTLSLLTEISREREITLVMSLHNIPLAQKFLSRLVGLRGGRIRFDHGADRVDDMCFHRLFELDKDEMMRDGA